MNLISFLASHSYVATGVAVVVGACVLLGFRRTKKSKPTQPRESGLVYLHQFPRWKFSSNSSSFCIKLETYLRLAKIPYTVVSGMKMSSKGKKPFIEYNGQEISDSELCIDFLNKEFQINLNEGLSDKLLAEAHAFSRMMEERTYWAVVYNRWNDNFDTLVEFFVPPSLITRFIFGRIQSQVRKALHAQGLGRHTREEIVMLASRDLKSAADYLGDKPFFCGDHPTQADCVVYGILSSIIDTPCRSELKDYVVSELPNLVAYNNRIREFVFPDTKHLLQDESQKRKYTKYPITADDEKQQD